jgi:hypothetical protein
MAASAVGMAAGASQGRGGARNNEFMQAAARQACTTHAQQYGSVQDIGVKQADAGEIVVSGTVTGADGKNWFECSFVTEITGFTLRRTPSGT